MSITGIIQNQTSAQLQPTPLVPNNSPPQTSGISFGDVLDAVNPLQHIPVVSSAFRALTGSHISAGSEIAGDALYGVLFPGGAVAGLASSVADVAVTAATGSGIAQHVVNTLGASPASQAQTYTPLTPGTQTHPVTQNAAPPQPIPLLNPNHTQAGNAQYMRAQALDSLNSKLLKMAV